MNENLKNNLKLASGLIKKSRKIILACHFNPDGDAIGSMLGLGLSLSKLDKHVTMLCSDRVPARYASLPSSYRIKRHYPGTADLAISVDCGGLNQLANIEEAFNRSKRIIEIDHHAYRTRFGDIQLIDEKTCSVGEIVFLLLKELGIKVDKKVAECLLTSIIVETLSFSRPDVKKETFDLCSKLMESGINFRKIADRYYWRKRLSAIQLSGVCLFRARRTSKDRLIWSTISMKDFADFHGRPEDVDAVPDDMMLAEGVKIALLFREIEDNTLRVSLRSRDDIDIGYLASMYGGGGHHDVAGCRIHNNKKTIEKFIMQACDLIDKKKRGQKK